MEGKNKKPKKKLTVFLSFFFPLCISDRPTKSGHVGECLNISVRDTLSEEGRGTCHAPVGGASMSFYKQ